VDYVEYIWSQFYWFDKWFSRHPKIFEIGSIKTKFPAEKRLTEYLSLLKDGETIRCNSVVVPSTKLAKGAVAKINQDRLSQLEKAWGLSEEEVLAKFGSSGFFDAKWINSHPVYKQLVREGRVG
jgi:hypothetical protein